MTLYTDENVRVIQIMHEFFEALHEAMTGPDDELEVTFTEHTVWANDASFDLRQKVKSWTTPVNEKFEWLKARLDRARLAGVVFAATVEPEAVTRLTKKMLGMFRRKDLDAPFDEIWSETYPGLELLERRFEGTFASRRAEAPAPSGSAPSEEVQPPKRPGLSALSMDLLRDNDIRDSVERIRAGLDVTPTSGSGVSVLELIDRIVELMPEEAARDSKKATRLAAQVLDTIAARLATDDFTVAGELDLDEKLREQMLQAGLQHFIRDVPEPSPPRPMPAVGSPSLPGLSGVPLETADAARRRAADAARRRAADAARREAAEAARREAAEAARREAAEAARREAAEALRRHAAHAGRERVADAAAGASPTPVPSPPPVRVSRPGDDKIADDLPAMLRELRELGPPQTQALDAAQVEDHAEQLGTYLHLLVTSDGARDNEALHHGLARLLSDPGPAELEVLRQYLQPLLAGEPSPPGCDLERVAQLVRDLGKVSLLRQCGVLGAQWVVREFPDEFLAYLETLDFDEPADVQELDEVCRRIGPRRFRAERGLLARQNEFLRSRTCERIFELPIASVAPLARMIFQRNRNYFKERFGAYLQAAIAKPIDKALLDTVGDIKFVSIEYLVAIAEDKESKLQEFRQSILYAFVVQTEGDRLRADRRVEAIKLLSHFDTPVIRRLLQKLADGRKFLIINEQPKAVREAADEVLRSFRAA